MNKQVWDYERTHNNYKNDIYRLGFHLMPPTGWLNDPNGLCWFKGLYHVFFQYSPYDANGGDKYWGHYTSKDLIKWTYEGAVLSPDIAADADGVYSGCAVEHNGEMALMYTGNVKHKGDYDYILNGREANQILVTSKDGHSFSEKKVVLTNDDYPDDFTCHVRDPKIWKDGDVYKMVLGGRKKGDVGAIILYSSTDLVNWKYEGQATTKLPMGYMWECPDYFKLGNVNVMSASLQGLSREEFRYQNVYQSGYFKVKPGTKPEEMKFYDYVEWDMGFDFYAPQTFEDNKGRRILIGWIGMPDSENEYTNKTVESGWQHALTVPRELNVEYGIVHQYPVAELEKLRRGATDIERNREYIIPKGMFDMECTKNDDKAFGIQIGNDLKLEYQDGMFTMKFINSANPECEGAGRTKRNVFIGKLFHIRVLCDTSVVEVYINKGEKVMTTRFYKKKQEVTLKTTGALLKSKMWPMASYKTESK